MRLEHHQAHVITVSGDRTALGVELEDGEQQGLVAPRGIEGAELLQPGEDVAIDVAYLPDAQIVVRVLPSGS
jgi:hypothetical protein